MGEPQSQLRNDINQRLASLKDEAIEYCYQCAKCTAGCEAHKLLELEPHKIIALLKRGLIDEMINSDVIWTCMTCLKCRERCPQKVAPVEALFALKNLAVAQGKQIPGKYSTMLQTILSTGLIQDVQDVPAQNQTTLKRDTLGLPSVSKPTDLSKFQAAIMKVAVDKV